MHKFTYIPMLASLLTLGACQLDAKNIGTPDTTDDPSTGTDPITDPTDTAPATGSDGPTDTATDTIEPADTDTDDTSGGLESCLPEDPATSAAFKVLLDAWPDQPDDAHSIDRTCTIDGVTSDATTVITALTCDVDGVPRGATFEIAAAPEGEVDWGVGQSVALHSYVLLDQHGDIFSLRMTAADDPEALLVAGDDWWGDSPPTSFMIGPIRREITNICPVDFETERYELTYSLSEGASVNIASGRRDVLVIDPAHAYVIDLAYSGAQAIGGEHSLIRRVKL